MTSILPETQHCEEAPKRSFVFEHVTASTAKQFKSLTTTMQNAWTLLRDGYEFDRITPTYYLCTAPLKPKASEQAVYNLSYDPALGVASCSCDLHANIGICKHIIALHTQRVEIDEIHDQRVAAVAEISRLEAEKAAAEAQAARDNTPAFWTRTMQRPICSDDTGTFTVIAGWNSWDDFWRDTDEFMAARAA